MQIKRDTKLRNILQSERTKTGLLLAACFVLPCAILLVVFASYGFAPFGDKSLMIMDMSGQYSEFFCGLKNISSQNGGILFSWSKALGGNYAGVFAYYVASPLSFITLFFPNEYMHMGVLVLTLLKIGLCGLTFGILMNYLIKIRQEKDLIEVHDHAGNKVMIPKSEAMRLHGMMENKKHFDPEHYLDKARENAYHKRNIIC